MDARRTTENLFYSGPEQERAENEQQGFFFNTPPLAEGEHAARGCKRLPESSTR